MTVSERLGAQGSWSLAFKSDDEGGIPKEVFDSLDYHGHIVITSPAIDLKQITDPLPHSRYTGVLLEKTFARGGQISGAGLIWWLGDENKIGNIPEADIIFSGDTHASAIAKVLTPEFLAGTIYSQAPTTMTGVTLRALVTTPRENLDRVTEYFGTEWVITPQGVVNAGTQAQLYPSATTPTTIILPRESASGDAPNLKSVPIADASQKNDRRGYATRVLLAAQGQAGNIPVAAANLSPGTTYKDLRGNTMVRKKIISESSTDGGLAPTRALGHLAQAVALQRQLTLSTEDYEIVGEDFTLGDTVWGYDELSDLSDPANQVEYQGKFYNPTKIRIVGYTYPITEDYGVYYRDKDGGYTDLTKWVEFEQGATQLNVGAFGRSLVGDPNEQLGPRITADSSVPAIPVFGTITSLVYTDDNGIERCRVTVPWSTPANTDLTAIVDGAFYELAYQRAGSGEFNYKIVPWGINVNEFTEFPVGSNLNFKIQASDSANPPNRSGFSALVNFNATADSVAPGTPGATTNAGNPLEIQVTHNLQLAAGGLLPDDMHHLNVYIGTSAGFTAGPSNYVGKVDLAKPQLDAGTPVVESFGIYDANQRWVRVKAVDNAGNESVQSAASTVTAQLLSTGHYSLLSVTDAIIGSASAAKLTTGQITSALIELTAAGELRASRTAGPFNYWQLKQSMFRARVNGTAPYVGGTDIFNLDFDAGTLALKGAIDASTITGSTITGGTIGTNTTGRRIVLQAAGAFADRLQIWAGETILAEEPSILFGSISGSGGTRRHLTSLEGGWLGANNPAGTIVFRSQSADGTLQPQISIEASGILSLTATNDIVISALNLAANATEFNHQTRVQMNSNPIRFQASGDPSIDNIGIGTIGALAAPILSGYGPTMMRSFNSGVGIICNVSQMAVVNYSNSAYEDIIATAFVVSSDENFKEDIAPIPSSTAVSTFRSLKASQFKLKADSTHTECWGFIAQEVPLQARRLASPIANDQGVTAAFDPVALMAIHWEMTHALDHRLRLVEEKIKTN